MSHIDTAEMYGFGDAEEIVGDGRIASRRDEIFLVFEGAAGACLAPRHHRGMWASLARLGTDRLDCYLLHWRGNVPLEESLRRTRTRRQLPGA